MSIFILKLDKPSLWMKVFVMLSLMFLVLVFIDKKIKFKKVLGMEHTFRMKNYSTSEAHFRVTIFLPMVGLAFLVAMSNKIFTTFNPTFHEVSKSEYQPSGKGALAHRLTPRFLGILSNFR